MENKESRDMQSRAEKYREEMMKLYSRRSTLYEEHNDPQPAEEITDEPPVPEPPTADDPAFPEEEYTPQPETDTPPEQTDEEKFGVDEDAPDDTAWSPHPEDDRNESSDIEDEYNSRYPEPDISELDDLTDDENTTPPEYATAESMGDAIGYIQVYVRTGDESSAVAGASVIVSAVVDGRRLMIATGVTDGSGTAPRFSVPVPQAELSQSPGSAIRPYSLFDISVTADGFFNARSVDVPAFEGITSVQNFSMIPVPYMMNGSEETVTYYNQEPF
ncbi:MAG: carboxypeptidase regulatory-like domain-containing protein [Ruminococcus sp.]|nr:carboxypeptidase regulatory-like domain-containing protein [Ruminococcus sp.]